MFRRPAKMEFAIDVLTGRLTMVEGWRLEFAGTSLIEPQLQDNFQEPIEEILGD